MKKITDILLQFLMILLSKKIPVKLSGLTPLPELSKILSHKQKFLTRMSEHEGIASLQVLEFIIQFAWHFFQHGALQMYYLIVGKNQNILLTVCISHGKCHLIMIKFTEIRIQLHIFQEIVHPSHIPFQGESQAVIFCLAGYHRPCGRFLRNHDSSMISSENNRIQMLEEFNGFQVLVSTVFIGNPLTVFFTVIQIEHGCNRVYTETVNVAFFYPVKGIGDQEILYFRTSVIVDLGSPVRMLALSRICMLVYCSSVKVGKSVCILREVRRYPVKDNTDFLFMQIIYHISKIFRRTISGSRCIISGYLITPGAIKRMGQLSVGIETILVFRSLRMFHP